MIPSHAEFLRIASGEDRSANAKWWRAALRLGQPFYYLGLQAHRLSTLPRRRSLKRPTLSIGNLTTGGTGKTPMAIAMVSRLQELGHRPAVLLRGYGVEIESRQNADEAEVLRNAFAGSVPVEPNPDRIQGAADVLARNPEVTCFVLDDAFQHRRARRDLNLVLIDATRPFGFDHLLPRGLLREPKRALRRADGVIVTRSDQVTPEERAALDTNIKKYHGKPPLAHAVHAWTAMRLGSKFCHIDTLKTKHVFGVCGIGNPATFERQLSDHAEKLSGMAIYDDHYKYRSGEVSSIVNHAIERGASAVVTTEKDWVKWRKVAEQVKLGLPVYRPVVAMEFLDGGDEVQALLEEKLPVPIQAEP